MADAKEPREGTSDPLWMFRIDAKSPSPREVSLEPRDEIYKLYRQTENPFLRRAISPGAKKLKRTPEDLQRLLEFFQMGKFYHIRPAHVGDPMRRRSLEHPAPIASPGAGYVGPRDLQANPKSLPWMVHLFFEAVTERLRYNPASFKQVVDELLAQFQADGIRIKLYEAYRTFRGWDDLLHTLEEIQRYPAPETFDLFCSALFSYYRLLYPNPTA